MGKLLSNPKIAVALIAGLAVFLVALAGGALGAAFGGGFLGSPVPHIQLAAESVATIGGYSLNNTTIMFWASGLVLLALVWLATRRMREVPGRLQALFEAIVEFFDNTADSVAGGARSGRRYLPVMLGIFLIVLFSNWMGILPGVGSIGRIETVNEFVDHRLHDKEKELQKEAEKTGAHPSADELHEAALLAVLEEASGEEFTVFNGGGVKMISPGTVEATKVRLDQVVDVGSHDVEALEHQLGEGNVIRLNDEQAKDYPEILGKEAGILVPYLRGSSTDLNTTLAVALTAMFMVQLWGVRSLGVRTYAGKFLVNPLKGGPILTVVGFLEAFSEVAKAISFTFRLFGNMFAGEILLIAMGFLLPLIGMIPFLGLELFVGLIQAFVFGMLTLVFGVSASAHHGEGQHEAGHAVAAPGHVATTSALAGQGAH